MQTSCSEQFSASSSVSFSAVCLNWPWMTPDTHQRLLIRLQIRLTAITFYKLACGCKNHQLMTTSVLMFLSYVYIYVLQMPYQLDSIYTEKWHFPYLDPWMFGFGTMRGRNNLEFHCSHFLFFLRARNVKANCLFETLTAEISSIISEESNGDAFLSEVQIHDQDWRSTTASLTKSKGLW